ncbi:MAG: 50S ribosomal protein L32 [Vampirovibrionales bacterium]|nr:50S ribosomal protein L32 [Vampirovibrionales bacterium]
MPVPKQRVGHSDQGHRRSNWKAILPTVASCTNCGAPRHPHTMCGVCGFYKNRVIPKALQGLDFGAASATGHVHDENCGHDHDHSNLEGHVHDEHCDHDHTHDDEAVTVDVVAEDVAADAKSVEKEPEA